MWLDCEGGHVPKAVLGCPIEDRIVHIYSTFVFQCYKHDPIDGPYIVQLLNGVNDCVFLKGLNDFKLLK